MLADSFSQEFEWQQVSSSLQDSSQYSGRSQQYCRLDSLYPSAIFQVLKAFHVPRFFQFSSKVEVLILLFTFLQIYSVVRRDSKVYNFSDSLFFLLMIMRSGLLVGIRWSVCMLKSHMSLCESFSRTGAGLCIYHLFVWPNWNFLHISQWITVPTQSCLALYSFCANLQHSLIMWLIVSSLSPHRLHLQFCCVLSRFDMFGSYGVVLCCY